MDHDGGLAETGAAGDLDDGDGSASSCKNSLPPFAASIVRGVRGMPMSSAKSRYPSINSSSNKSRTAAKLLTEHLVLPLKSTMGSRLMCGQCLSFFDAKAPCSTRHPYEFPST